MRPVGKHVGALCDRGVLCVTSCTGSPLHPPTPGSLGCGREGKLLAGHVPSPEWSFGAVTVTATRGTEGQVQGGV